MLIKEQELPLHKLLIHESIGESLPDNPDSFQDTVTLQLVEYKLCLNDPTLLLHVR